MNVRFFFIVVIYTLLTYCYGKNQWDIPQNIFFTEERNSGMTLGGWVYDDRVFIFGWNIPLFQAAVNWIHSLKKDFQAMYDSHWIVVHKWSGMYRYCWFDVHAKASPSHTTAPTLHCNPCQVRSSGRPWACPARGSCCANISVSLNGSLTCCLFGLASCFHQNQYVAQEWESNDWNARLSIGITHRSVLTWRGCVDIGVVERIG